MPQYIGLYLHGFLSSGQSQKGQWFKSQLRGSFQANKKSNFKDWLTPTYPIGQVSNSIEKIEGELTDLLEQKEKIVLLGSSMGGFYAQYFGQKYGLPYVMINPALNPEKVFNENLGVHENPATGETVNITKDYIDQLMAFKCDNLDSSIHSLMLIDQDDEVIDVSYALKQYPQGSHKHSDTVVYSGGDHSFIHLNEAWTEINCFVKGLGELL